MWAVSSCLNVGGLFMLNVGGLFMRSNHVGGLFMLMATVAPGHGPGVLYRAATGRLDLPLNRPDHAASGFHRTQAAARLPLRPVVLVGSAIQPDYSVHLCCAFILHCG
jgi:hypothetical protein